jgi:hypothetical protein
LRIVFERGSTPDEVEIFESIRIAGSVVGDKVGGLEALEAFVPVIAGIEELTRNLHTGRPFPKPSVVFLEYNISSIFSEIVGRNVIS